MVPVKFPTASLVIGSSMTLICFRFVRSAFRGRKLSTSMRRCWDEPRIITCHWVMQLDDRDAFKTDFGVRPVSVAGLYSSARYLLASTGRGDKTVSERTLGDISGIDDCLVAFR